jgi:hypothetical protein
MDTLMRRTHWTPDTDILVRAAKMSLKQVFVEGIRLKPWEFDAACDPDQQQWLLVSLVKRVFFLKQ